MKVTKKAKKTKVTFHKTESYYSSYSCPTCGINLTGAGIRKNVVSFRCECGQVLVIDNT